jgi:replicative DNA helicase
MTTTPTIHASTDAEASLLACCIAFPDVVASCIAAGIGRDSFYQPEHGIAFDAVVALAGRGGLDASTLAEELKARGQLAKLGGWQFITKISANPTSTSSAFYIERVGALAKQRRLIDAATGALAAAQQSAPAWSEVWDRTEPFLRDAQSAGAQLRRRSIADVAAQAAAWRLSPDLRPAVSTPWAGWDRIATMPRAGELIVVAGRPGTGKTTLAGNIAHDTATGGKTVAFFSLEMAAEELVDRFAVRRAARRGVRDEHHAKTEIVAQIHKIGLQKNLHIYEVGDAPSIAQIEATCRLLAASPDGLGCVVVDYLQLVEPPADSRRESREQQVAAMTRRFKLLARSINAPIFLLSQLNRESEKEDRRPRLSDLRESGSIEQDADRVWFLYHPKTSANEPLTSEDAAKVNVALYQCKCRNGPVGIDAVLTFNRPAFDFTA